MSRVVRYTIDSIDGGVTPTLYNPDPSTYSAAIGIDPDLTIDGGVTYKTSGAIVPVQYSTFSSTVANNAVIRIITTPKTELVYAITNAGRIISYSNTLGSETNVATVAGSTADGAEYYNNYIYIFGTGAGKNDVSRYGPLDGVPALTDAWWTGLGLTALTSNTYAVTRQTRIPSHWGHVHGDNNLYFCDYALGQGLIHKIRTKVGGGVQGADNDGSAYNVLDLPFGSQPTCIESYGTDLAISAITGTSIVLNQGRSQLFFWDTFADTFYNRVDVTDPLTTALFNNNNTLYVFSGNITNGYRVSEYLGGKSTRAVAFFEDGAPPFAGAVDSFADRVTFGSFTNYPESSASCYSYGSKDPRVQKVIHNTIRTVSTGANPIVTAVKYVLQASNITPRAVVAWIDDSAKGIDAFGGAATMNGLWRSRMFRVGKRFVVRKIQIPITATTSSAMSFTVSVYTDDINGTIFTMDAVTNTSYPNMRNIIFKNPKMDSGTVEVSGFHNFVLEIRFAGGQVISATFPIEIEVEVYDDEAMPSPL